MSDAFTTVLFGKTNGVATITLNRPAELNPLDAATARELHACMDAVEGDPGCHLVVLRAAGRAFSAGGDMKQLVENHQDADWMRALGDVLRDLIRRFEACDRLVIAVVEGLCVAGGVELVLACDYVLAGERAKFSDGHLNFSLLPAGGTTQRLPRNVGVLKAKDFLLTARTLSGAQAVEMGLATACVPADQVEAALGELVANLSAKSFSSRAAIKHLINRGRSMSLEEGMAFEAEFALAYETTHPDAHEGLVAFLEKRAPRFGNAP